MSRGERARAWLEEKHPGVLASPGPVGACPHGCSHRSRGIQGATSKRGYGAAHQKQRASIAPLVNAGGATAAPL